MPTNHAMVDIETWGIRPGSVIVSIGGCRFDPTNIIGAYSPFKLNVSAADAMREGLVVDAATVEWWMQQSEEARNGFTEPPPVPLRAALNSLVGWYNLEPKTTAVWSHGATFDIVLLEAAFNAVGIRPPWGYRDPRDTRTLFDLAGFVPPPERKHDALEDALVQAGWVQQAYSLLIGGGSNAS